MLNADAPWPRKAQHISEGGEDASHHIRHLVQSCADVGLLILLTNSTLVRTSAEDNLDRGPNLDLREIAADSSALSLFLEVPTFAAQNRLLHATEEAQSVVSYQTGSVMLELPP